MKKGLYQVFLSTRLTYCFVSHMQTFFYLFSLTQKKNSTTTNSLTYLAHPTFLNQTPQVPPAPQNRSTGTKTTWTSNGRPQRTTATLSSATTSSRNEKRAALNGRRRQKFPGIRPKEPLPSSPKERTMSSG